MFATNTIIVNYLTFGDQKNKSTHKCRKLTVWMINAIARHMGREHASREKKLTMVNFFIFVQKNVSTIRF